MLEEHLEVIISLKPLFRHGAGVLLLFSAAVVCFSLAGACAAEGRPTASTAELPAALVHLGVTADQVLSAAESRRVRGQALTPQEVLASAAAVAERAKVVALPGGVFYFQGVYFGDGLLINQRTGRGAILSPSAASPGAIMFQNLQGNFTVQRDAQGMVLFLSP